MVSNQELVFFRHPSPAPSKKYTSLSFGGRPYRTAIHWLGSAKVILKFFIVTSWMFRISNPVPSERLNSRYSSKSKRFPFVSYATIPQGNRHCIFPSPSNQTLSNAVIAVLASDLQAVIGKDEDAHPASIIVDAIMQSPISLFIYVLSLDFLMPNRDALCFRFSAEQRYWPYFGF